jgi:branched-chain amino acid transport system substrate-binding protein
MPSTLTRRTSLLLGSAVVAMPTILRAQGSEPLKIGVLVPTTGVHASDGIRMLKAHQLAAKQINEAGGIRALQGAMLELVVTDIQSKPEISRAEAERLISRERVSALIGAWASATTIPAAQVAERNRTPFMITSAVNDALTEQGMKYVFRTAVKAKWFGGYVADFLDYMKSQGASVGKIALATEDGPAGQAVHANYSTVVPPRGYPLVADETFKTGTADFSTIATKLRTSGADVLLTCAYAEDSTVLLRALMAQSYRPLYVGFGGAHVNQTVLASGRPADRTFGVVEWAPDLKKPASEAFVKAFAAAHPGETPLSNQAQAFAATYALVLAAEAAKSTDRIAIRDALRILKITDGPASLLPQDVLSFDEQGQSPSKCVVVQAIDGKFVTVWPENVAARPPAKMQG